MNQTVKSMQTMVKNKKGTVIGLLLVLMFAVSGLLAVRNNSSLTSAAVVVESAKQPAGSSTVDEDKKRVATPAPTTVVENRMTEEAKKAAAATRALGSGEASYYGAAFAGRPTANGEQFNPAEMTAAHRTLPFGSKLRVTNTKNGRSVIVRVNDRGPYAHNRVIDLSEGAAERIGMVQSGTANVKLELILS